MLDWEDAERRVEKAQQLFEQRRWQEALEELRAAIAINPHHGGWLYNVGLTLDELGRFEEAVDAYRQALELEPQDVQALYRLGLDLHRVGRHRAAIEIFQRLQTVDAAFEPGYCQRILIYVELGDHERAEEMFYLARLYREHCPHCYYNVGCSLYDRGLYEKAIYCWQRTLDLDENHPEVHLRIAEALWSRGELERARQHYVLGLRQQPGKVDALLDLGELLTEMGRSDEAGEKFRRALEQAPDDPATHYCHARWLMQRNHETSDRQAITELTRTLALDSAYCGAHLRLAQLLLRQRRHAQARRHLRAELMLRPRDPRLLLELGNALLDSQQPRAAVACLKRLVGLAPDNVSAWQNLAVAQFHRGCYEEGITACRRALQRDPNHAGTMYNLALALGKVQRFEEALQWIRQARHRAPRDASIARLELRLRLMRGKSWLVQRIVRMMV